MARYLLVHDGEKLRIVGDKPPKVRPKRKRKTKRTSRPTSPAAREHRTPSDPIVI